MPSNIPSEKPLQVSDLQSAADIAAAAVPAINKVLREKPYSQQYEVAANEHKLLELGVLDELKKLYHSWQITTRQSGGLEQINFVVFKRP